MQIKLSLAVCEGTVESDPQTLLTLELDSHEGKRCGLIRRVDR